MIANSERRKRNVVRVDLQEGYSNDEVVVKLDGEAVYCGSELSTNYSVGLAHSLEIVVMDLPAKLEITLPQKGISTLITLEEPLPVSIGVALREKDLVTNLSDTGFEYF